MSKARYVISRDNFHNTDNVFSNVYCTSLKAVAEDLCRRKYFSGTLYVIDLKNGCKKELNMASGKILAESKWC